MQGRKSHGIKACAIQYHPDGRFIVFESGSRGQWDIEVLDRGSNIELDIPDGAPASGSFQCRCLNSGALVKHSFFVPAIA